MPARPLFDAMKMGIVSWATNRGCINGRANDRRDSRGRAHVDVARISSRGVSTTGTADGVWWWCYTASDFLIVAIEPREAEAALHEVRP